MPSSYGKRRSEEFDLEKVKTDNTICIESNLHHHVDLTYKSSSNICLLVKNLKDLKKITNTTKLINVTSLLFTMNKLWMQLAMLICSWLLLYNLSYISKANWKQCLACFKPPIASYTLPILLQVIPNNKWLREVATYKYLMPIDSTAYHHGSD